MSWNLLTYALPLYSAYSLIGQANPNSYKEYDKIHPSSRSDQIYAIVEKALKAENVKGSEHFEAIQDLLEDLPDSAGPKTIKTLISYRLKAIDVQGNIQACTTGTDLNEGKYYLLINSNLKKEVLPFIVNHELAHILKDDALVKRALKTVSSFAFSIIFASCLNWSLLPSLLGVIGTNVLVHHVISHIEENEADDFAIKHCSKEELKEAISFFKTIKVIKDTHASIYRVISQLLHPSEEARMLKISRAIDPEEEQKSFLRLDECCLSA